MNMYKSGELEQVMSDFEKAIEASPIYFGGDLSRAEKEEKEVNGRIQNRYRNNNYYNNGNVNNMFLMFFSGYASGKQTGRNGDYDV